MEKTPKALIIVDMLNDFLRKNGALFCGEEARTIIPFIRALIDEYRREGGMIVYLCDSHRKDDREFDRFPPHCVMDTVGGLANRDYGATVYEKGVADFDHELARCALERMRRVYGARIVT
jgi:nicotinamidase-related amidase